MQRKPMGQHGSPHCRWGVRLLAAGAVALAVMAWRGAGNGPQLQLAPAVVSPARAPQISRPAAFESPATVAQQPSVRAAAAPPPGSNVGAVPSEPVRMEICGFGMVTLPADDPDQLQQVPQSVRNAVMRSVTASMLDSGDPQARAAALLIGTRSGGSNAHELAELLARLAVGSQDAAIYAMALEGCRGSMVDDSGSCQLLSRAQWVRLDPDNVLPWLELAAEAQQRDEPQAEAEAMRHAALARRSDAYEGLLPGLVERSLASQASPLQRTLALSQSWTVQTAWAVSRSSHAYEYCTSGPGMDADRHSCEAVAETLAQRSLNLADLGVGLAIGRNLGWSAERLHALQQVNDAVSEISGLQTIGLDLSCDGIARTQGWLRQLSARGELPAMRDAIARGDRAARSDVKVSTDAGRDPIGH
jgi:hypothetical protein